MKRKVLCAVFVAAVIGSAFSIPQPVGAAGTPGICQAISQVPKPHQGGIACTFIPLTPIAWAVCSGGAVQPNCTVTIVGAFLPNGMACTATGPKPTIVGPCIVVPFVKYLCVATWETKESIHPKMLTCTG